MSGHRDRYRTGPASGPTRKQLSVRVVKGERASQDSGNLVQVPSPAIQMSEDSLHQEVPVPTVQAFGFLNVNRLLLRINTPTATVLLYCTVPGLRIRQDRPNT